MGHSAGVNPQVRGTRAADLEACLEIMRALPDHFTSDALDNARRDLGRHDGWVIVDADRIVGFVVVARRSTQAAEILWAAVEPGRRNGGLGTQLLDHVLAALRDQGVVVTEVKTLDRSEDYEPYEATRAFWERSGFVQIDCIDPMPGWEPGNPAAIYVAALEPTRHAASPPAPPRRAPAPPSAPPRGGSQRRP